MLSSLCTSLFANEIEKSCSSDHGIYEATMAHAGRDRQYILYRPNDLPSAAPLVFMLHGLSGTAASVMNYTGLNKLADNNQFAVVYPQGLKLKDVTDAEADYGDATFWNADPDYGLDLDDVDFLTELAAHLHEHCQLSAKHRFIAGHSNGGAMSYSMACLAPAVFRAVASIAGPEAFVCESAHPIPVLHIHGVKDTVVPIGGSESEKSSMPKRSIRQSVEFWAKINKSESTIEGFLPPKTTTYRYTDGLDGNEVWYYRIEDWGHGWSRSTDANGTDTGEVIWAFFSRYLK